MAVRSTRWFVIAVCAGAAALMIGGCFAVASDVKYHCVAVMLGCDALLESDCLAIKDCKFDGGCVGKGCETFLSRDECFLRLGCGWSAGGCRAQVAGSC